MECLSPRKLALLAAIIVTFGRGTANAQSDAHATNNHPDPYSPVENWAQLPAGVEWGQVISVQPDAHGNIWVFHRKDPPILEFSASGKFIKSFGAGMFIFPHGIWIEKDGSIWLTDGQGRDGKGHQVFHFSPSGKVLMTLGKPGEAGDGPDTFNQPNAVAIAPNGDIFVSDGHNPGRGNARVVKFSKGTTKFGPA